MRAVDRVETTKSARLYTLSCRASAGSNGCAPRAAVDGRSRRTPIRPGTSSAAEHIVLVYRRALFAVSTYLYAHMHTHAHSHTQA